jgi:hypothetical protein
MKLNLRLIWFLPAAIFTLLASIFIFVDFNNKMQEIIYRHGTILLIGISAAVFLIAPLKIYSSKIESCKYYFLNIAPRRKFFSLLLMFIAIYPIYRFGGIEDSAIFSKDRFQQYGVINIFEEYKARKFSSDISDFRNYYSKTKIFNIPLDLIEFIRQNIPPNNLFAYNRDEKKIIFIPVFANQNIAVTPNFISIKGLDDGYLNAFRGKEQIIFNDKESNKEKLTFIYRFKFDYVMLDPAFYHLGNIFNNYACFQKIYDKEKYSIYKIDKELLGRILKKAS